MKKPETKKNVIEVKRVKQFDSGNVICDLCINGVTVYGCRVVESRNGDFIGFPQYKGSDNKYYSHAYCKLSEDEQKELENKIQKMTDKYIADIEKAIDAKSKDILTV